MIDGLPSSGLCVCAAAPVGGLGDLGVAVSLAAGLGRLDWAVLIAYFAILAASGIYFARKKKLTTQDYFLAGRHMPVWAVTVSTLATAQSAATFIGVPEQAYKGDLTYISTNIGTLLATAILAVVFIPAFYRINVTTPYQLLETRFGRPARVAASVAYMVGRVFASGARVFVGAIPVSIALYGDRAPEHLAVAILGFMLFGILYTLWGGLESAIWTDVLQVGVYLGAAVVALIVLWHRIPAPAGEIVEALSTGGAGGSSKLAIVKLGIDPSKPAYINFGASYTLITACTGWTLLMLGAFGTDQDLVQRLLACRSAVRGSRSMLGYTLLNVPVVLLFAAVGLLLWVFYTRPELMGGAGPAAASGSTGDATDVFLRFILNEMPGGAAGLMIAGVLAAGPAGINASLNSMSSTFVNDVYKPLIAPPEKTGKTEAHYLFVGRVAVIGWGLVLGGFALVCIWWQRSSGQTIIDFVLGVMNYAYAGLLGVFLTALLTKRGNSASAIASLVVGFLVVLALEPTVWTFSFWPSGVSAAAAEVAMAPPWRLCVGCAAATVVCLLGNPRRRAAAA